MLTTFIILGWLLCATLCAGIALAFFQREFPLVAVEGYRADLAQSWGLGLLGGPIAFMIVTAVCGFGRHGFMNPFVLDKYNKKD